MAWAVFVWKGKYLVQPAVAQPPAEAQDEAPIFDETSPEQLQREQAQVAGRDPDAEPVAEPAATETPAPEPAPTQPAAEAPPAQAPTPQTRVYTQAEYDAEREQWRRRAAGAQRQAEEVRQKLAQVDLEAQVEAHLRGEEARLAQTGLTAEDARQVVRHPDSVRRTRDHFEGQQRLQRIEQEQQAQTVEAEVGAMVQTAVMFQSRYKLSDDDTRLLMTATTPQAMEALAKRLKGNDAAARKEKADLKATVPPETRATALESGISGHSAPESDDTRINRLNDTPSWEWSDDDTKFMRRLAS